MAQGSAVANATGSATSGANTLTISGLTAETSYIAYLIVKDSAGNISAISDISFTTPDATAPTITATIEPEINGTDATLNFDTDEAGTYYYLVLAAVDGAPDAATVIAQGTAVAKGTNSVKSGANSVLIAGLSDGTAYFAYVVVKDLTNNISAVSTILFETPDVTVPTITATNASAVTGSGATLNFSRTELGSYYYLVLAASVIAPNAATVMAEGGAFSYEYDNSVSIEGLASETAYIAYVVVEDIGGNISAVSPISFTTLDATAPTLSLTSASEESGSGAKLNFSTTEAGTYYYLVLAAGASTPNAATVVAQGLAFAKATSSATSGANSPTISGLSDGTSYKAHVVVKDSAHNISAVSTISFTTLDTTAPTLSLTSASPVTASGATLNFSTNQAGTYYYLVLAAGASAPDAATVKLQGSAVAKATSSATSGANSATLTGLVSETAYKAYLVVEDASGNISAVSPISFTTLDATAPTLSETSAPEVSGSGATLNFSTDEAGTYYYLVLAAGASTPTAAEVVAQGVAVAKATSSATSGANSLTISGLAAETAYVVYVVVKDNSGNTSGISSVSLTTLADLETPLLSSVTASNLGNTQATLNFTSSEAGTYYYLVLAAGASAPDAATVKLQGVAIAKATGSATSRAQSLAITSLGVNSSYTAYVIVVDAAGNESTIYTVTFKTTETNTETTVVNYRENPSSEQVMPINQEIQYNEQADANIWQLQLGIQSIKDISAIERRMSQQMNSIINPDIRLVDLFINQLIKETTKDSFVELLSVSKDADRIEYSNTFERIYGQSFGRWYVRTAVPKVLSAFELSKPSTYLNALTTLSPSSRVSLPEIGLKQEKEVLQKNLKELLQDSLIAYGGATKFALYLESTNSKRYKSRPLTAFRLIYGYTFQEWYRQVGQFDLRRNLGMSVLGGPNLKMNKDAENIKRTATASNLNFGTQENLREGK